MQDVNALAEVLHTTRDAIVAMACFEAVCRSELHVLCLETVSTSASEVM
jgi:hypothetical protein